MVFSAIEYHSFMKCVEVKLGPQAAQVSEDQLLGCVIVDFFLILFLKSKLSYVSVAIQLAIAWRPIKTQLAFYI